MASRRPLIVGIGCRDRGDDALGLLACEALEPRLDGPAEIVRHEGDAAALIDRWAHAERVVVIDAMRSGRAAGTVTRFDVAEAPIPERSLRLSSHTMGLVEAIELARALGRLPRRLVIFGIEGARFALGDSPSTDAAEWIERVCHLAEEQVAIWRSAGTRPFRRTGCATRAHDSPHGRAATPRPSVPVRTPKAAGPGGER